MQQPLEPPRLGLEHECDQAARLGPPDAGLQADRLAGDLGREAEAVGDQRRRRRDGSRRRRRNVDHDARTRCRLKLSVPGAVSTRRNEARRVSSIATGIGREGPRDERSGGAAAMSRPDGPPRPPRTERGGFEPPNGVEPRYAISSRARSTTPASLLDCAEKASAGAHSRLPEAPRKFTKTGPLVGRRTTVGPPVADRQAQQGRGSDEHDGGGTQLSTAGAGSDPGPRRLPASVDADRR